MTRKHYVMLAEAMKRTRPINYSNSEQLFASRQWDTDCNAIADALSNDNPKFDRDRFLKACGID